VCQGQLVIALVYTRQEKRKAKELAEKEGSKQAKISAVSMGLSGLTLETRISETKIYKIDEMDIDS
jgi:hypothetical protein